MPRLATPFEDPVETGRDTGEETEDEVDGQVNAEEDLDVDDQAEDDEEEEEMDVEYNTLSEPATPTPVAPAPAAKKRGAKPKPAAIDDMRRSSRKTSARLEALRKTSPPGAGVKTRGRPSTSTQVLSSAISVRKKRGRPSAASQALNKQVTGGAKAKGEATKSPDPNAVRVFNTAYRKYVAEYVVEKVLDSAFIDKKLHYFVKWKGYPTADNTWEPVKNVVNADDEVQKFHKKFPKKPSAETPVKNGKK
ncbi:chromo domain-containing protein [Phlyctema vagabunda]|uniref:Chromo domain-containing protein n=1 Tax=Phlyctema vagabunda TaxID=108571 RepID=A0ABR4PRF2_9HELO